MEENYWIRRRQATRHSFIHTAGPDENYWTRQSHSAGGVRVTRRPRVIGSTGPRDRGR
jgi:hypothetical protein